VNERPVTAGDDDMASWESGLTELKRIPRDLDDMVEALRRHTRILRVLMTRAFDDQDRDFYGEVAGKLRLLLLPLGRNKPLLRRLLAAYGKRLDVHVLGFPLAEYLDQIRVGWGSAGQTEHLRC
jgi:hypothetical protein